MTLHNITCPGCGLLCDDLSVERHQNRVTIQTGHCPQAEQAFADWQQLPETPAECQQTACHRETALAEAARLLSESQSPLIFGAGSGGTAAHRAALALADRLGATIDLLNDPRAAIPIQSLQNLGLSTCSLGEVRHRADLILFWGADPMQTHHRLFDRIIDPAGEFVPQGRAGRKLIVIDSHETATSAVADQFIPIPAANFLDAVTLLRQFVRGQSPSHSVADWAQPLPEMAAAMRSCQYGTCFYGAGLLEASLPRPTLESLTRLVFELCDETRFTLRGLGQPDGETVSTWQTGYPHAVNFARGYPRSMPDEFSASAMLEQGDADCALILGLDAIHVLPEKARRVLVDLPTILLTPPGPQAIDPPVQVRITTSVAGFHTAGTAYRLDDVAMKLSQVIPSDLPSEADVLEQLRVRVEFPQEC